MKRTLYLIISCFLLICCKDNSTENKSISTEKNSEETTSENIHISAQQAKALQLKVDTLSTRNMGTYVEANGKLEVPPQNEASITSILGANVVAIEVIEGDKVAKGQAVAYLSHPNIITLQTDYLEAYSNLNYLEKEFRRQKKLYEGGVTSGMNFQKTENEYTSAKGLVSGLEAKLRLLNLNPKTIQQGSIRERVALTSPIEGFIQKVTVKTGQYVTPQTSLFEVVNIHHVHADLMVYEKDVHKISEGQEVTFSVQSIPDTELSASIYSVGKTFEEKPKAVHVHAEIINKKGALIPGMYIKGRIELEKMPVTALPEDAIAKDGEKSYAFIGEKNKEEWIFTAIEVKVRKTDKNWISVVFLENIPKGSLFAYNNAYYLLAESQKEEGGHHH